MSTNKTTHYGLHQWDAADTFLREEINENFTLLDGASRVVFGSYQGDGTLDRSIELGFTPKSILIFPEDGVISNGSATFGGMAGWAAPARFDSRYEYITLESGGVKVSRTYQYQGSYHIDANNAGKRYFYLASY